MNGELAKVQQTIDGMENDMGRVSAEKNRLMAERNAIAAEMRKARDKANVRVNALQRLNREAYQLYSWYQQNREKFRGPVYVPLVEVSPLGIL